MTKVLVTGGCGFIGSHTTLRLLEEGHEVLVIDSNINSSSKVIDNILKILNVKEQSNFEKLKFIKGDIKDTSLIDKIFKEEEIKGKKIEAVVHFAGLKSVKDSVSNPLSYWMENIYGTLNLLEVMKNNNCNIMIFSSTAMIYSSIEYGKLSEQSLVKPSNPYGFTKLSVENILDNLFQSKPNKWKIACLRYFNPIGAHPSGLIGEDPLGKPNNLFPLICRIASKKYNKLSIFGKNWNTPDNTCVRDYIHVMDVADGHIKTLNHLLCNNSQILKLNLGRGEGLSVLNLIKTFEETNNIKIPYDFKERRQGDVAILVADNSLAKLTLNWSPNRSYKEMCRDGWNWEKNNFFLGN